MTPGFRILLIDDDEVDRARVLRALREEGRFMKNFEIAFTNQRNRVLGI